ncbi:MAG: glycosyltransferase family 2 protein [Deltaproteobacteria bacterium]|nr:glycosyltransferase family 2 protein [Deltaproteobacteria bacterium]MBZ0219152.1 glycosyltransferase family 2 protein [Deltaproteobacteria bacterium]
MPDVSVIIVNWNARDYLLKCLASLRSGLGRLDAEVIVVDNASSDGSARAVREGFPEVKLLEQDENLGFARANNIGMRESSAGYVCLVNSDVIVLDGSLEELHRFLEARPEAALAGPRVLNPDESLQPTCRRFPSLRGSLLSAIGLDGWNYFSHDRTARVEALSGCLLMIRRKAIDDVGMLDERFFFYAEDKDWCKRFHDAGYENWYCTEAEAVHYGGSSSGLAPVRFYVEMQKANLKYWEKHRGRAARAAYVAITLLHQLVRFARSGALYILKPAERRSAAHKAKRSAACLKWLLTGGDAAQP